MFNCKPVSTPIETNFINLDSSKDLYKKVPYKELIGCLLYVTQTTRPDLCFAVNYFSR